MRSRTDVTAKFYLSYLGALGHVCTDLRLPKTVILRAFLANTQETAIATKGIGAIEAPKTSTSHADLWPRCMEFEFILDCKDHGSLKITAQCSTCELHAAASFSRIAFLPCRLFLPDISTIFDPRHSHDCGRTLLLRKLRFDCNICVQDCRNPTTSLDM